MESITAISFSNKVSRYICSGGSGQVVRIWDLQRKRCIKWLRGHTNTITGAIYNCKDEHLASISLSGDLILHNLASGARAAELKDPNEQVLRVLDYSRISRHLLVTAGDDGTVHLWDTTGRNPKVSWLKQHSAPTAGVSFSPSNDKIIASVGLDKKLYTYDSGSRRPSSCIPYEAPFSSLAFRDDGWTLAAGTSNGRVVFYDVRGKPQPFVVLHAYSSSEAVTSLCWQRSKHVIVNESNCTTETALVGNAVEDSILMPDPLPSVTSSSLSLSTAAVTSLCWQRSKHVIVNESNCTTETALVGNAVEDSILMPDPLPSVTSSSLSLSTAVSSSRNLGRLGASMEASSLTASSSAFASSTLHTSTIEETPHRSHLRAGGTLARLQAPRSSYNFKDEMEVFSPLVDVQPITPSLDKLWDDHEGTKKDHLLVDKRPPSLLFPSSTRRFPIADDSGNDHPIFDWKSSSTSKQDDTRSSFTILGSTPSPSSKSEDSSITPPEAWGVAASEPGILPSMNGVISQPQKAQQPDAQQGSSFTLQLFQRTLDETLDSFQKSIHEDMRNLHIEILRQFHMQEMEMSSVMSSILENQAELMKEVKSLRKENQQLRQLLIAILSNSSEVELWRQ
nr:isoform 2 of protein nedd1 [Quercus suber]